MSPARAALLVLAAAVALAACSDDRATFAPPAPRAPRPVVAKGHAPASDAPFPAAPPEVRPTDDTRVPEIEVLALPNGLRALLVPRPGLPFAEVRVAVAAGSDDAAPGVALMTTQLLLAGTPSRPRDVLLQQLTEMGATWHQIPSGLSMDLDVKVPSPSVNLALARLADVLQDGRFTKEDVLSVRRAELGNLDAARSSPHFRAWSEASRMIDPEAKTVDELRAAYAAVGPADVEGFFRQHVTPERTLLVVAGDFERKAVARELSSRLSSWRRTPRPLAPSHVVAPSTRPRFVFVDQPGGTQASVVIAAYAPPDPRDPDRMALRALAQVLGGGWSGRLGAAVREHYGVTYGADATLRGHRTHALFAVTAELETERAALGTRELLAALARVRTELVPEAEIREARARSAARAFATTDGTLNTLSPFLLVSTDSFAGSAGGASGASSATEPLDAFLRRTLTPPPLSPEELRRVAALYLAPERLQLAIVGDASRVLPGLTSALPGGDPNRASAPAPLPTPELSKY